MPFNPLGFKTVTHIGSIDGSVGTNRSLHAYVTKDDFATIETGGYFDTIAKRMRKGDIIHASTGIETAPAGKSYVVANIAGGAVTVAPFA